MARAGERIAFPSVRKTDPEDVSWALSTAEAMWNRGDHVEAVKWIRRAAEAASECDADERALELAKVAAELTQQIETGDRPTRVAPPTVKTGTAPPPTTSPPPAPAAPKKPAASSRPPPPKGGGPGAGPRAPAPVRVGPPATMKATMPSQQARAAAAELEAQASRKSDPGKKGRRASAGGGDPESTAETGAPAMAPTERKRARTSKPPGDEVTGTLVTGELLGPITDLAGARSAGGDPDAWPTESLASTPGDDDDGPLEHTRIGTLAYQESARAASSLNGPMTAPASAAPPKVSQAVRVWVYRTGDGLRVAPVGARVDAAVVEAFLVAVEPGIDLATWFRDP